MRVDNVCYLRPFYILAILAFTCVLITESCRKVDQHSSITSMSIREKEDKFFNEHRSASVTEKSLVSYFTRRNDSSHFIEKTVQRIGYPIWNKAWTFKDGRGVQGRTEDNSTTAATSVTFIPFVRDSQNYVNALMAVRTTPTDTSFRYLCDWQYSDTAATNMPADVFSLFMMKMDNNVFSHGRYKITDSTIFNGWSTKPSALRILDSLPPSSTNLLTPIYYTICFITYGAEYACGWNNSCQPGESSASCFNWCRDEIGSACFNGVIWEDDEDWGSGGGGTGSGGGNPGNGGGNPPGDEPPPCGGGLSGRGFDPCGPGWEPLPIEDDPPPPCDSYITALSNDLNFANQFKSLSDSAVLALNYEKGFYINDRLGNSYLPVQGSPGSRHIIFSGATLPMDGFLHVHTNGLNQAPMFSPNDVLRMADAFLKGIAKDSNNFFIGVAHGYGPPYLLKITNVAKFRKFAERITKMEENKEGKRFTDIYEDKFRFDVPKMNERGLLDMLNWEKGDSGVGLFRADGPDCRKWIKLGRDGSNQTDVTETACN